MIRLQSVDATRNRAREYTLEIDGGLFEVCLTLGWGRIGASMRTKELWFGSWHEAEKEALRRVKIRRRHGYRVVVDESPGRARELVWDQVDDLADEEELIEAAV